MIKINLAARKGSGGPVGTAAGSSAGGTETGQATGSLAASLSLSRIRDLQFDPKSLGDLRELPLKRIGVVVVTVLIANYLSSSFQAEELSKLDQKIEQLRTQTKGLKAELDKTKGFDAIKKSLENDELTMRTKIEVIQKLLVDRQKPPKVLLGLSNIIPTEVWLSNFDLTATEVKISGYAMSNLQVPEFQKNLSESADFKDVTLLGQSMSKDGNNEVVKFDLLAKRR